MLDQPLTYAYQYLSLQELPNLTHALQLKKLECD